MKLAPSGIITFICLFPVLKIVNCSSVDGSGSVIYEDEDSYNDSFDDDHEQINAKKSKDLRKIMSRLNKMEVNIRRQQQATRIMRKMFNKKKGNMAKTR